MIAAAPFTCLPCDVSALNKPFGVEARSHPINKIAEPPHHSFIGLLHKPQFTRGTRSARRLVFCGTRLGAFR
jgi:hypothetical protein